MSKFIPGLMLLVAAAFAVPAVAATKTARKDTTATDEKAQATAPLDKDAQQKLKEHLRLRNHIVKSVKYPATKESIVSTVKGVKDVKPGDKKWFEETLPNKTYESPDEVMKALGWDVAPDEATTAAKSSK